MYNIEVSSAISTVLANIRQARKKLYEKNTLAYSATVKFRQIKHHNTYHTHSKHNVTHPNGPRTAILIVMLSVLSVLKLYRVKRYAEYCSTTRLVRGTGRQTEEWIDRQMDRGTYPRLNFAIYNPI